MIRFSISEARERFADALEACSHEPVEITKHGKPVAVIVSAMTFERLVDAAEDLEDAKALDEALASNEPAIPWEEVKEELGLA